MINIRPHPVFKRNGNDIYMELPIGLSKAVLGGEVEVPTLNGNVTMKIPAGTQNARIFRLKGKGISDLHGYGKGDELVKVKVLIPTKLSAEQRRLIEEFARLSEDPSGKKESFAEKIKKTFK